MITTNVEKDVQPIFPELPTEGSDIDPGSTSTPREVVSSKPGQSSESVTVGHDIPVAPKGRDKADAGRRSRSRKNSSNLQSVASASMADDSKLARATRTKVPDVAQAADKASPVAKPRRATSKKVSKDASPSTSAPAGIGEIPPITPAAIEFLGKYDATFADMIKLSPESLEFVRYHLKRMQQLEVDSQHASAFLAASTRPASQALHRFANAHARQGQWINGELGVTSMADGMSPGSQASKSSLPEYGQKAVSFPVFRNFVMQSHKLDFPLRDSSTSKQGIDLAKPADGGGDVQGSDWDRAYAASSRLANLAGLEKPLDMDAITSLAKKTVAAIRAIEIPQYREQLLAVSHQIGLWHSQYDAEFRRQAPELAPVAEAAYKSETAKDRHIGVLHQAPENSIEQDTSRQVNGPGDSLTQSRSEVSRKPASSDKHIDLPDASATPDKQTIPEPAKRPSLGRRLLLAIMEEMKPIGRHPDKSTEIRASLVNGPAASANERSELMPDSVTRRFLKVDREYYFHDRTPAFSDRGNKLATRGSNPEVVRSFIEIAKARGWDAITVAGTDEFRRNAWLEGARSGLIVTGYKPSALDLAELANSPTRNIVAKESSQGRSSGSAESNTGISMDRDTPIPVQSAKGATPIDQADRVEQPKLDLAAKAKAFQENKPAFVVKKYPELAAAFGVVAAAKAFAADKLPERAREEFVELARRHMVEKILKGEQIHGPKIYLAPVNENKLDHDAQPVAKATPQGRQKSDIALDKQR